MSADVLADNTEIYGDTVPVTEETSEITTPSVESIPGEQVSDSEWYKHSRLIHHACGGIGRDSYTNSKEALQQTLAQGNMLVEVDFLFTNDGHLICAHKWYDVFGYERDCTLDEFLSHKIKGKYSGLMAADIIAFMTENPLLYIIVDTKEKDPTVVIAELLQLCDSRPEIANRFVIQLYEPGMKEKMLALYPFLNENFLFTCYKFGPKRVSEILEICREENIRIVTVPHGRWDQASVNRFLNEDILIFEHTVNDIKSISSSQKKGIYGFYTDFLQDSDIILQEAAE